MPTSSTPTHSPSLEELARRCEQASGPDRELDIAIHTLIDPEHVAYMDADYAEMKATIEAQGPEAIKHRLPGLRRHTHNPPRYTASLDAAMSLAPEGWNWGVWQRHDWPRQNAQVWHPHREAMTRHGDAAAPALALSAASLRAYAQRISAMTSSTPTHSPSLEELARALKYAMPLVSNDIDDAMKRRKVNRDVLEELERHEAALKQHLSSLPSILPTAATQPDRITFLEARSRFSIDEPIRVQDERGNPHLTYSGLHLNEAFKAGWDAALRAKEQAHG